MFYLSTTVKRKIVKWALRGRAAVPVAVLGSQSRVRCSRWPR